MADPIKKITLKNGKTRYRFVADIGRDPQTGKRKQVTLTFDRLKDARVELGKIRHQVAAGTYIAPAKTTLNELMDMWLTTATRDVEEATRANYGTALRPIREFMGERRIQTLTESDVEALVDWMLTSGRKRGGKAGTGVGARSVRLTLGRLRAALSLAVRRQLVVRNVAADVTIPREARKAAAAKKAERKPWEEPEVRGFVAGIKADRLYAVMLLSLLGLRPAEVCGLRWEDVDLKAGTVTIGNTRTIVYIKEEKRGSRKAIVEKDAKSESGNRTLPLPAPVAAALKAFHKTQAAERLAAGEAHQGSGYVLVDELGRPMDTAMLRRRAYKLMDTSGVRRTRLYDARHACLSWMANNGVPDVVVSAWAGHSDLGFTKRHYIHSDPQSLKAGSDKLAELLG